MCCLLSIRSACHLSILYSNQQKLIKSILYADSKYEIKSNLLGLNTIIFRTKLIKLIHKLN
jgi:hypothetical protein